MTLRRYAAFLVFVAFLWGVLLAFVPAAGVHAAEAEEPAPTTAESAAQQAARRVIERYLALESYSDTFHAERAVVVVDGEGADVVRDVKESAGSLSLARPNRLAMTMGDAGAIYTDGKTVWFHRPSLKQYKGMELDAIERLIAVVPAMTDVAHPALLLLSGAGAEQVLDKIEVTEFTAPPAGKKEARLKGRVDLPLRGLPTQDPVEFSATFSTDTGLLREFTLDLSDVLGQAIRQSLNRQGIDREVTVEEGRMSLRFKDVKVNGDLPAETFTYEVPEGFKEVEEFGVQAPGEGEAAPDFTGTTLEGQTIELSDLRGKVVVLDFWATWCGPCVQAMPHMEELATEFAGEGLVVLGVNQDRPNAEDQVRSFVADRGVSFTQVMDPDHNIGSKYQVRAIPRTVVIGPEGKIRHSHEGYTPESAAALRAKVEALLAESAGE